MDKLARRVLVLVLLAWVIDAADSTIYSLTLPAIKDEFGLDLTSMGMLASIFLAGTVLGAAILPVVAERLGRRIGICTCVGLLYLRRSVLPGHLRRGAGQQCCCSRFRALLYWVWNRC